jgi:CBS domain-containing protein
VEHKPTPSPLRLAAAIFAAATLVACATGSTPSQPGAGGGDTRERRVTAASADASRLQSQLLALADTALARLTAETEPGTSAKDPAVRKFSLTTRLVLGSALVGIVTGPDPVDALLDIVTHTTLVADGMRNEAKGKPGDSPQARVLKALELNEVDAWKLAERWADAPTRSALRELILGWPGERKSAAAVAYVRLSDLPRAGTLSVGAGEGAISALRAAVQQAEQARLLAERAMFLAQRMPFELRWNAELFMYNAVAAEESQRLLASVGGLTATADSAVQLAAGMPAQLSQERAAALQDLFARTERERVAALRDMFARVEAERRATLEQMASIIEKERRAILLDTSEALSTQRKAIFEDLVGVGARAEMHGREWASRLLVVVTVLIVLLLLALFGLLLLYRRMLQRMERHPPR